MTVETPLSVRQHIFHLSLKPHSLPFFMNIDWSVQLKQEDATAFLLQNYDLDVLERNGFGMSALSEGFKTDSVPVLQALLEHDSGKLVFN